MYFFCSGFIFNSSLYYLPQFFQAGLGYSPTSSGVFLLPVLVSQTVSSFCAVCISIPIVLDSYFSLLLPPLFPRFSYYVLFYTLFTDWMICTTGRSCIADGKIQGKFHLSPPITTKHWQLSSVILLTRYYIISVAIISSAHTYMNITVDHLFRV